MKLKRVVNHSLITTYLEAEVQRNRRFQGQFYLQVRVGDQIIKVKHGATIIATGGVEYKGQEYGYGRDPRILTQLEFEQRLADGGPDLPEKIVMIQCVGPGEKTCSRLCCTTALKNALKLKELHPSAEVTILYRDIRTYGFKERLYNQARQTGIRFIHFEFEQKPKVRVSPPESDHPGALSVKIKEPILDREIELSADMVVLSTPTVPAEGIQNLATALKLPLGTDGFFMEAHVKLRPVDFTSDGVFMAGVAHYPKFLDETITQAQAAASRAAITLSNKTMLTNARVAVVNSEQCVGCLTCVRICPYEVPKIDGGQSGAGGIIGSAYIEPAVCHGCGSCAAECPAQAIQLMHYKDAQILVKLDALFNRIPEKSMVSNVD
jgi:heterodisulfide reductase subunit A-like polyferredoxin